MYNCYVAPASLTGVIAGVTTPLVIIIIVIIVVILVIIVFLAIRTKRIKDEYKVRERREGGIDKRERERERERESESAKE